MCDYKYVTVSLKTVGAGGAVAGTPLGRHFLMVFWLP